jgi:hypothetical protein
MDNRYFSYGCPPLMQDGRFLTNHVRFNVFDQFVRNMNQIGTDAEYRKFLQTKGNSIIEKEKATLLKNNTCNVNGKCVPLSGAATNVLPCSTCYKQ